MRKLVWLGLVGALLVTAYLVAQRNSQRTVTAYFDRAVAVYPGTDLRVMGVQIGEVAAVVPEGDRVRVEMRYDDEYSLPAGASAMASRSETSSARLPSASSTSVSTTTTASNVRSSSGSMRSRRE